MVVDELEIKTAPTTLTLGLCAIEASLRTKIKLYKKRAREVERHLAGKPEDWGKFQCEFNTEINGIFHDIMNFEKSNFNKGQAHKVYKLKRLFINKIRQLFMRGTYIEWSLRKPYGYAGDFKIIDDIYQNNPLTTGFDRLFDNYYQMSAVCVAVRNRKEDFKRLIIDSIASKKSGPIKIMNLACGSAREVKEVLSVNNIRSGKNISFDCYDNEDKAIDYARLLLSDFSGIRFYKKNALRMAAAKNIESRSREKYDIIYSTGLFDYLSHKVSAHLIRNLRKLLKNNGILAVSNMYDKYSNPSVHFMEWVGDWNLNYRTDREFKRIFLDAGFKEKELRIQYEQQGIMQYIFAVNRQRIG